MEEALYSGLVVFALVVVVGVVAVLMGKVRRGRKLDAFTEYLSSRFPGVGEQLLLAGRVSKSGAMDIGLAVDEPKRELILVFDDKGTITHASYAFDRLVAVDAVEEVISRGIPSQRTYSFQRTLKLSFDDGKTYPFILENISNKKGTAGRDVVIEAFRPWEDRLNAIVKETQSASL